MGGSHVAADSPPPLEPGLLAGRSVLVTGGSMGIGLACAAAALASGARVVIAARGGDALDAAAETLRAGEPGGEVHAVAADVAREEDVARLVDATIERSGRLHGLVHAAAVQGPIGPTADVEPEAWLDALRINLYGTFLVARATARAMRAGSGGRMVLLSGGGAATPFPRYTAYAASKAAVVRFAESLAIELKSDGIAVNALAPGFVATRLHRQTLAAGERAGAEYLAHTREQLERGGVSADVAARAAVFLLSDRAQGLTGKFVAAPWDAWWDWPMHVAELCGTDLFTLRRVVPRDRRMDWQ